MTRFDVPELERAQLQPAGELSPEVLKRVVTYSGCRQLDGERETVEPAAEFRHRRGVVGRVLKGPPAARARCWKSCTAGLASTIA